MKAFSKFHKLMICDGLEALETKHYNTPFPSHFHQTYNISLVYDGVFRTKVSEKNLYAQPGTILITNPFEIHSNPCESNGRVSFFTFYISPDFYYYSLQNKNLYFQNNIIYDDMLFKQLNKIAVQLDKENYSEKLEKELGHTLNALALSYASIDNGIQKHTATHSLFNDYLANQNFGKFSLDHAVKEFGINKYKFIRLFKFQTGLTPANYFMLKRIEKSKKMLLEGEGLLNIAIELDFYDIPHFSNHFKKFTGISPSVYSLAGKSSKIDF